MTQTAKRIEPETVHQEIGTVVSNEAGALRVSSSAGTFAAKRALSCLVEPEPGDRVILAVPPVGDLYLLAILERESAGVTLKVEGPLTVTTDDKLVLEGREQLSLATRRFDVRAGAARFVLGAVELIARAADAKLEVTKLVSDAVDVVSERLMTRTKRSYRFVEELDVTRARDVDVRAEETLHVRGKNALMSAEQLYKVDAEQIHLG